jgi:hypothetical protein
LSCPSQYREPDIEEEEEPYPANIMFDRRVIRGNTYAAQILPAAPPATGNLLTSKRRKTAPRPPPTPNAVEGRRHIDVQTDSFLEELTDTIPERDVNTQTDPFMDRPPTPLFIPMKIGVDAETQIEAGDLFDFDFEVEPILEVLVGKTLEQGLMEVMEEEELAAMRAHQEHFEQIRNAELVATQRMEAAEKRKIEEKEHRLAQVRSCSPSCGLCFCDVCKNGIMDASTCFGLQGWFGIWSWVQSPPLDQAPPCCKPALLFAPYVETFSHCIHCIYCSQYCGVCMFVVVTTFSRGARPLSSCRPTQPNRGDCTHRLSEHTCACLHRRTSVMLI